MSTHILSLFKGITFSEKLVVAPKLPNAAEKFSGIKKSAFVKLTDFISQAVSFTHNYGLQELLLNLTSM
jgi:hypothetical protein